MTLSRRGAHWRQLDKENEVSAPAGTRVELPLTHGIGVALPIRYERAPAELLASARVHHVTKALVSALALASIVAGCSSGAQEAGPVPTVPTSTGQTTAPTTTEPTPSTSTKASAPIALCADKAAAVNVDSEQGAAGTIRTVWRVRNIAQHPCRSFGYPGMDFHSSNGWLGVQVHRGGFPDINQPPARVVVDPGRSLYFVSYWNDVTTNAEPCAEFDHVKLTQPDNFAPVKLASSGCLNPQSVDVGPVRGTRPS